MFENVVSVGHPAVPNKKFGAVFVDRNLFNVTMFDNSPFYPFGLKGLRHSTCKAQIVIINSS